MKWYSARSLFLHRNLIGERGRHVYEERIVLLWASDEDAAMALAEESAKKYARTNGDVEWLMLIQIYVLDEEMPGHGDEVFSLMRDSELGSSAYLNRFFDNGDERQR